MNKLILASAISTVLLSGCGGSDDNDDNITNPEPTQAEFSLGVSDAPVSDVKAVWVAFDSITLNAGDGEMPTFETRSEENPDQPVMVNLLDYTGDDVFALIDDELVAAGDYEWLRADIVNGDMANIEMTSHLVYNDDTVVPLVVTRKGNDGIGEIQINDFTLVSGDNDFVLEFDLKKSLVNPSNSNEVKLKPTGIRLENLAQVEDIEGVVSQQLVQNCETDNADIAPATGGFGHAVYLYNSDVSEPKDLYLDGETVAADAPIATGGVSYDEEDERYEFEIGFVAPGEYQLAYTCAAHIDDAEILDESFTLYQQQTVTVTSGEDAQVTFDIAQ
ncbi:DUF4382 domain-containing protein [Pseudoalteromonas sp. Cnat2-41]|uniref:DUF4382 domain-containing protein n=1 Tax=unclassified Pseudoalteromonas TaxID=194690 RepID=UPI001EF8852F|nr:MULTISPECIES: DUF4382 domain-containing protein [unclassified Pseudoalteromonas]MCF2863560.1 DUF4382 domain-containing protein [Pseudoalteromonas sp. CNAT2-18]MCG7558513.1 DUF4382 domain-containing protein [Pseudoalteromonas sp. CNAT2-18.1]